MHIDRLRTMFTGNNEKYLFPCIVDLASNGVDPGRFTDEDRIPSRQDVTQYIAAWFKYTGRSSSECQEWMTEYCMHVLSAISSSSKSRIRHSTKSNIKYIYKSDATFSCMRENNPFKASCGPTCPIYEETACGPKAAEAANVVIHYEIRPEDRIDSGTAPTANSVKDAYKDQFEKAIEVARHHIKQMVPKQQVVNILNERGFKTRTGRRWSYSILANELKKSNGNIDKTEAERPSRAENKGPSAA